MSLGVGLEQRVERDCLFGLFHPFFLHPCLFHHPCVGHFYPFHPFYCDNLWVDLGLRRLGFFHHFFRHRCVDCHLVECHLFLCVGPGFDSGVDCLPFVRHLRDSGVDPQLCDSVFDRLGPFLQHLRPYHCHSGLD